MRSIFFGLMALVSTGLFYNETHANGAFFHGAREARMILVEAGLTQSYKEVVAVNLVCQKRTLERRFICTMVDGFSPTYSGGGYYSGPIIPPRVVTIEGSRAVTLARILGQAFPYAVRGEKIVLDRLFCIYLTGVGQNRCTDYQLIPQLSPP